MVWEISLFTNDWFIFCPKVLLLFDPFGDPPLLVSLGECSLVVLIVYSWSWELISWEIDFWMSRGTYTFNLVPLSLNLLCSKCPSIGSRSNWVSVSRDILIILVNLNPESFFLVMGSTWICYWILSSDLVVVNDLLKDLIYMVLFWLFLSISSFLHMAAVPFSVIIML